MYKINDTKIKVNRWEINKIYINKNKYTDNNKYSEYSTVYKTVMYKDNCASAQHMTTTRQYGTAWGSLSAV